MKSVNFRDLLKLSSRSQMQLSDVGGLGVSVMAFAFIFSQRHGMISWLEPSSASSLQTLTLYHIKQMADHPVPEMLRLSLSELALRTKIMKIDIGGSIEEILSRALDPPSSVNIRRAVASLVETGALTQLEDITPLGRYLAHLPTDVALGKFLLMAVVFKCLDPALTIAAALSSKSPFVTPLGKEAEAQAQKATFRTGIAYSSILSIVLDHN